ncbi:MAG: DUF4097 family beta strand repeat-containing protein [Cyclobacteriaceae bacterium]
MKTILAATLLLIVSAVSAQDFSYTVKGNATETVVWVNQLFGDLQIEGISGSEIKIRASDYEGLPEKARGLKPLSGGAPENTGIGLSVTQEGNTISIAGAHREADDAEYLISLPKNVMLKIDYNSWQAEDVKVVGMENEIEAKSQVGDLVFVDVTGPIVAHTLSSDLDVVFSSVNQAYPSSITSTSGDIDVTLPSGAKGTFKMATVSGGIYTDLDFDLGEDANKRRFMGQSATGKLSGGGVEVSLKTVSGDVYVRKAN